MAVLVTLSLVPLVILCVAIAVRYAQEQRKPPGTRHLPGPWGETLVEQDGISAVVLTGCFRTTIHRKNSWHVKVLCLVPDARMGQAVWTDLHQASDGSNAYYRDQGAYCA